MPNGGPDCCGNCSHNRAVQEMERPNPEQPRRFWQLSYCALRNVKIANPFWTYCVNFSYYKHSEARRRIEVPVGWISACGLYEGYVRIPWDDKNEPRVSVRATCAICGRKTNEGIEVTHDGHTVGFCSNHHYVQWWKTLHQDDSVDPDHFESPEARGERE